MELLCRLRSGVRCLSPLTSVGDGHLPLHCFVKGQRSGCHELGTALGLLLYCPLGHSLHQCYLFRPSLNDHGPGGFKQQRVTLSSVWGSEV